MSLYRAKVSTPMMDPLVSRGGGGGGGGGVVVGHYFDRCITPLVTYYCKMCLDLRYITYGHTCTHSYFSSLISSSAPDAR